MPSSRFLRHRVRLLNNNPCRKTAPVPHLVCFGATRVWWFVGFVCVVPLHKHLQCMGWQYTRKVCSYRRKKTLTGIHLVQHWESERPARVYSLNGNHTEYFTVNCMGGLSQFTYVFCKKKYPLCCGVRQLWFWNLINFLGADAFTKGCGLDDVLPPDSLWFGSDAGCDLCYIW